MRRMVYVSVLIGLAAACTPPSSLSWTIDFASGAPRPPEVTAVRAWIRAGGCEGDATIYSAVLTQTRGMAPAPPLLDHGSWGFGADALDAECRTVASACEEVAVPSTSVVELLLERLEPPSAGCSAPAVCVAGACVVDDGGAAMPDAGPPDAGCVLAETECSDGRDDDCDGAIDCADSDCAGQSCAADARCGGGVCCATCVDASGTCVASTGRNQCGRGGEACMRCPDCVDCQSGRCIGSVSAGTSCSGGTCIGATVTTCCTGCVSGDLTSGTCEPGTAAAACGSRGDLCVSCAAGEGCTSRNECCGGCTASTGFCRAGTSQLNCGTAGAECVSCGAGNSCCPAPSGVGGVCVTGGCTS